MYSRGRGGRAAVLVILLLVGAVIGSVIGQALSDVLPILDEAAAFGFSPSTLQLAGVFSVTLGLTLRINLATVLGLILALLIYRRI